MTHYVLLLEYDHYSSFIVRAPEPDYFNKSSNIYNREKAIVQHRIVSVEIRQSMYNHGHAKQYVDYPLL